MASQPPAPPRSRRKLLVASLGVATMTYVGANCGDNETTVANLVAPPMDASRGDVTDDFPVANLVAPPVDASSADGSDAIEDFPIANLVPPPDSGMR